MAGSIFENFAVSEILKSYLNAGKSIDDIFFYRDVQKREIDLLIRRDGVLHPVEIKKTATPTKNMIDNFTALDSLNIEVGVGAVICLVPTAGYLSQRAITLPIDCI